MRAAEQRTRRRRALDLTEARTIRAVAQRAGLRQSRELGQHFLVDRAVLDEIVDALAPLTDVDVLEIGCGIGTLTTELAKRARRVVAVDIDDACVSAARVTQRDNGNVTVMQGDALQIDAPTLGMQPGWVLSGNLPYQLTGALLTRFFEAPEPPSRAVFLVQREVARRLCAPAGGWSLATVAVRSVADVECLATVPPAAFEPPPRVHSAVIRMRPARAMDGASRSQVLWLARVLFQARRKTLRHGVANALGGDAFKSAAALDAAGIDIGRRPGTLDLDEWQRLARAVDQVRDPDT